MLVNGKAMAVVRTSTATRATFLVAASGTYELDLIWPNPSAAVDVNIQTADTGARSFGEVWRVRNCVDTACLSVKGDLSCVAACRRAH